MDTLKKFQGPVTDFLDRVVVKLDQIKSVGNGKLEKADSRKQQGVLHIKNCNTIHCPFSAYTHQIFDIMVIKLTELNALRMHRANQERTVYIPLQKIMEYIGTPKTKASRDNFLKRLKQEMNLLAAISLDWSENKKVKGNLEHVKHINIRILSEYYIRKGTLVVTFAEEFADCLINSYVMDFPLWLLKNDNRNPNMYFIAKKLAFHVGMKNNVKKGSNECISIRALLDTVPTIPTIDEVDACDPGHWRRRVVDPLENALNQLQNLGYLEWSYCGRSQTMLDDDDVERHKSNFYVFRDLYIKFRMK